MPEPEKPKIKHAEGDLPNILDATVDALVNLDGAGLYVWAGGLYRLYRTSTLSEGAILRQAGALVLHKVDAVHLAELATDAAEHYRWDRRAGDWRLMNCPKRVADAILSRGQWLCLPHLSGIGETPTITLAGRLVDRQGFDWNSGLYIANVPDDYKPPIPDAPMHAIKGGIERLLEIVSTFPFLTEADRAALIAAMLTTILRRSLPSAPMIAITAPTPGTGKSLLADVIATLALGRQAAMIALGRDENENEKRLYAAILAGDSVLVADNLEVPLRGAVLAQLLTQPVVRFRPLGASAMVSAPTNLSFIATGNNLGILGDLRRRTMLIRLDAAVERPEQREFKRDALAYVSQRRGRMLRDLLQIPLAYLAAGEPEIQGLPVAGGFRDWDRLVRRPLVWAGLEDPLRPAETLREIDPDLEQSRALFNAWRAQFGDDPTTVADAIGAARQWVGRFDGGDEPEHPELREALQAVCTDKLDSTKLAGWLRRHRDRIVDGLVLRQAEADNHRKVARWRVDSAGDA